MLFRPARSTSFRPAQKESALPRDVPGFRRVFHMKEADPVVYYDENVPLFRKNGYRKSGTMILRVRSRDTALN